MSEVEFEQILNTVRLAMDFSNQDWAAQEHSAYDGPSSLANAVCTMLPQPANDNGMAWPFIPFPEGWCASC